MFVCESEKILHYDITCESRKCSSEIDGLVTLFEFIDSFAKKFDFVAYDWDEVQNRLS
jgi:hypothetical protein